MIYCENCGLCHEKDMFGHVIILECERTHLQTEPDGFCKWGVTKEENK